MGIGGKLLKGIPVISIVILGAFGLYVTIGCLWINRLKTDPAAKPVIISAAVVFFVWYVVFLRTIFTSPGRIPEDWLSDCVPDDEENLPLNEDIVPTTIEKKKLGGMRYCRKCQRFKPDRTHHCRNCRQCVLKMDHHCPWIANCVGFNNYKFFMLFLFYSVVVVFFVFFALLKHGIIDVLSVKSLAQLSQNEWEIFICFLIDIAIGVAVTTFFGFHIYLLLNGYTTIELLEKRNKKRGKDEPAYVNHYDLGGFENFKMVFGKNPLLWLIPVKSWSGEGIYFPTNAKLRVDSRKHAMDNDLLEGSYTY